MHRQEWGQFILDLRALWLPVSLGLAVNPGVPEIYDSEIGDRGLRDDSHPSQAASENWIVWI